MRKFRSKKISQVVLLYTIILQGFIQDFQFGGGRCCVWVNWDGRVYFLLALPVGIATVERLFSHMKESLV